jgi:hypothetical protein
MLARGRARWGWQPDKWERLSTAVQLTKASPGTTVADVGGRHHELRGLMAGCRVISVNLEAPCDVLVSPGAALPFEDKAFDVVVSTDVLEHMPESARAPHVADLLRVARDRVVLCFPVGTETKSASERRIQVRLEQVYGVVLPFLEDHVGFGLPRVEDVVADISRAQPGSSVEVLYSDGVAASEDLILDAYRAVKGHEAAAVLRSARAWLLRRHRVLTTVASEDNSRAFIVIDLAR